MAGQQALLQTCANGGRIAVYPTLIAISCVVEQRQVNGVFCRIGIWMAVAALVFVH